MASRTYEDLIAEHVTKGWRIEEQTPTHTLLHKGADNEGWDACHGLGCLLTLGLWIIPWIVIKAMTGLKKRRIVRNPDGTGRLEIVP